MALLRVADVAFMNPGSLAKPSEGLKMSIRIARRTGADWEEIAALTTYTAKEIQEMIGDNGTS